MSSSSNESFPVLETPRLRLREIVASDAPAYEIAPGLAGRGLMQEALRAVLDWGFAEMGELHRVEAQIHPDNTASLKLAHGLGFVQEGRAREVGFWGGRHHDLLQLSLLRREWQTQ